jgi:large exoprotein involved in heme utilization and adhesion
VSGSLVCCHSTICHLSASPTTLKRLGDGYYEQRLIREQVIALTGQRYLDGYTSDEAAV